MENSFTPILTTDLCASCSVKISTEDTFCNNCGYPLKGTEQEQKDFLTQVAINEIDMADYQNKIKQGGTSLYYVAGVFALGTLVDLYQTRDQENLPVIMIIDLIIVGIFVFLGGWSRKKPFAAMVSGICLYGIVILLTVIGDPVNIVRGIIFKIIIISLLVKGIRAAMDIEKMKKETHLG
jgi:hypothetical protein